MAKINRTPSSSKLAVKRSPLHGRGLFAKSTIRKGTLIGIYEGRKTKRDGTYVLWVEDDFGIDGTNELRFVNHSPAPNAVFWGEELHAIKTIREGDEITHHYGPEWEPKAPKRRQKRA